MSLLDTNYANLFVEDLKKSSLTRNDFFIPYNFNNFARDNYMFNSSYNYYCRGFHDDFIGFVFMNNNLDSFNSMNYVRLYDNGNIERYFIHFSDLEISKKTEVYNYINSYCYGYTYYDGIFHTTDSVVFNKDIYDELAHSNKPSEIIFSMLYCLIPIILFLIGFKVLRKGLFK